MVLEIDKILGLISSMKNILFLEVEIYIAFMLIKLAIATLGITYICCLDKFNLHP